MRLDEAREADAEITWEYHMLGLEEIARALNINTHGTRPEAELKSNGLLLIIKGIKGELPQ